MKAEELEIFDFNGLNPVSLTIANLKTGSGMCIIKNFPIEPDDTSLIEFAKKLGEPLEEEININGKYVFKVEVNKKMNNPTYANTAYEFWGHTDCTDFKCPPDTVLLLCEKPDDVGGESYILPFRNIKDNFTAIELFYLSQNVYPFLEFYFPILKMENEQVNIRYNRASIDISMQIYHMELDQIYIPNLDKLDNLINQERFTVKLEKGDCLILNNKTILHGRTAFAEVSDRLMKRVRLNLS